MTIEPSQLWQGAGTSSAAPFPRLRTAYLRAIARAWREPDYLAELVKKSKEESDGVLHLLEKEYNFDFPFNVKFAISVDPPRPSWRPNESIGWLAHKDEISIILPRSPAAADKGKGELADALALYCEWFPSMLGPPKDGVTQPPDDFAEFGVITARLLAIAWNDKSFADDLAAPDDARGLVQASMGIIVHWNFKLKFSFLEWDEFWKDVLPPAGQPRNSIPARVVLPARVTIPPRVAITVNMPQEPPERAIWPIALAAYNDTGPQYPFTCA